LVTGGSLVGFSYWFRFAGESAAIAFYLWSGAYGLVLVSQFWILTNERVNSRDAKRMFGFIGASGILGGLAGGAFATFLGELLPTHVILLVAAGIHAVGALIAGRSAVLPSETAPQPKGEAAGVSMRGVLQNPYVRLLALLFLVGGITSAVLDYQFKLFLQEQFEPGRITSLLGTFYGAQNIIALLAQLGAAGFLLAKFGARFVSMALPAGILLGSIGILSAPVFLAVLGTRLFDATLRVSISRTAWEFLYFPLPDNVRAQSKRFIDVVISRSADAGAGIIVIALGFAGVTGITGISAAILVLAALWIAVEVGVSRSYKVQIAKQLRRGVMTTPDRRERVTELKDLHQDFDWERELQSDDEAAVVYALEILRSTSPGTIESEREYLLHHPSPRVRARALSILIASGAGVEDVAWELPAGASMGSGDASAEFSFEETTADRVAVAAAAARGFGSDIPRRRLHELIHDPEADVRHVAYRSAGQIRMRELVIPLIAKLEDPVERGPARTGLTLYGESIVGALGDYLADTDTKISTRLEIVKILNAVGSQNAALSLFRSGHLRTDRIVLNEVLRALNDVRTRDPEIVLPWSIVRKRLDQEILRFCERIVQERSIRSIADEPVRNLLSRVLKEKADQSLERIFRRLALVYNARETVLAYEGYRSGNARLRAQSIEYLDSILETEHKQKLLPVLEARTEEERVRLASDILERGSPSLYGTLMELLESRDSHLNAWGLFTVARLALDIHLDQAYGGLRSSDPIVRDTAEWAIRRLTAA
ncbi:MAG: hypothetical protein HKN20_15660, partial [Gemmatimonadetes bacterium]|nr:hypothetical protein [Gemmatimonadota bacterium]